MAVTLSRQCNTHATLPHVVHVLGASAGGVHVGCLRRPTSERVCLSADEVHFLPFHILFPFWPHNSSFALSKLGQLSRARLNNLECRRSLCSDLMTTTSWLLSLDGRFRHTSIDFITQRHPQYELLASASSIEVVVRMSQNWFPFLLPRSLTRLLLTLRKNLNSPPSSRPSLGSKIGFIINTIITTPSRIETSMQ